MTLKPQREYLEKVMQIYDTIRKSKVGAVLADLQFIELHRSAFQAGAIHMYRTINASFEEATKNENG